MVRGASGKSSEDDAAAEPLAMQMETLDNTQATTGDGQVGLPPLNLVVLFAYLSSYRKPLSTISVKFG